MGRPDDLGRRGAREAGKSISALEDLSCGYRSGTRAVNLDQLRLF
jgi:hypothetical protein